MPRQSPYPRGTQTRHVIRTDQNMGLLPSNSQMLFVPIRLHTLSMVVTISRQPLPGAIKGSKSRIIPKSLRCHLWQSKNNIKMATSIGTRRWAMVSSASRRRRTLWRSRTLRTATPLSFEPTSPRQGGRTSVLPVVPFLLPFPLSPTWA